jgi:uncharacterized cupredoxin-like copper-binding protein
MNMVPAGRPVVAADVNTVTLVMREYRFEPATTQLKVGEEVELTIRSAGKSAHEWLVGSGLVKEPDGKGFQKDLFALLKPAKTGRHYSPEWAGLGSTAELIPRISSGLRVEARGEVRLRFVVPAGARGEWQMGCLLSGHYETGMKGTLRIE